MLNNTLKKIAICTLIFFVFCSNVIAQDYVLDVENGVRVFDFANLFSSAEKEAIQSEIDNFINVHNYDMCIVTTNDAQGKTSRDYADDFYDYNGLGFDEEYSGVLFLMDMDNREIYISTSGYLIDYFTDSRIEDALDDIYESITIPDYQKCAQKFINWGHFVISEGIPDGQYRVEEKEYEPSYTIQKALIALGIGFVAALITCCSIAGVYKFKRSTYRYPYTEDGSLELTASNDFFVTKFVTTRKIETSSGGGSGSSVHSSSSGRSHGGGGRSF